ncbi:MAG: gamma carbonic anhydrase family protein [Gemmatimonadetes bacterium]|nr:gamma carbonic anhydrase family protein [Gemmatimonadota bacterium]
MTCGPSLRRCSPTGWCSASRRRPTTARRATWSPSSSTRAGSGAELGPCCMRSALLLPFNGVWPQVADDAFLAPGAVLIGNVHVGAESSIWFGAVLRGDHPTNAIVIGPRTSVQDRCVIHVGNWRPTTVGANCTIGHGATFESCLIEDDCTIGMNAVILQEAVIGQGSLVAAGSVVLERTEVPPGSLVAGVPARVRKPLEGSSKQWVARGGDHYVAQSRRYLEQGIGRVEDARRGDQP